MVASVSEVLHVVMLSGLIWLVALAWTTAWTCALRAYPGVAAPTGPAVETTASPPVESAQLLAALVGANVILVLPVYVLGSLSQLHAGPLFAVITLSCVAVLFAARVSPGELRRAWSAPAALIVRSLREVWRTHPVAFLLVLYTYCGLVLAVFSSYFAPSWRSYDAHWYHEPIVGFTIQNHGFAWVPVPQILDMVNANPRFGEMTQFVFALFGGRRLVEVASVPATALFVLAAYGLFRGVTRERGVAVAWACIVALTPALWGELQSTYVDVHATAMLIAALVFALRGKAIDLVWMGVSLAAAVATKYYAWPVAPLIFLIGCAVNDRRHRGGPGFRAAGAAAAMVLVAASFTLVRNVRGFGNPVYPISIHSKALGVDWAGMGQGYEDPEVSMPWGEVLRLQYANNFVPLNEIPHVMRPHTQHEVHPLFNYGLVFPYLIVPLLLAAFVALMWRLRTRPLVLEPYPWACALVGVGFTWPLHYARLARYHGLPIAACVVVVIWFTGVLSRTASRQWVAIAAGLAAVAVWLQSPSFVPTVDEVVSLAGQTPLDRECKSDLNPTSTSFCLFRDTRLGPGAVTGFYSGEAMVGTLWNADYSNRVVWIEDGSGLFQEAEKRGARALVADSHLVAPADGWVAIGQFNRVNTRVTEVFAAPGFANSPAP